MRVDELLGRLEGVRKNGRGWQARCPAHADTNPSLSISERDDKTLIKCHAGCETSAIIEALGLTMADLFSDAKPNGMGAGTQIVRTYDYRDEHGALLFQVLRYEPKAFKQRRPDGSGGWLWNLGDVRRVLYRLPEVVEAKCVMVCEGEKDCDTAGSLGLVATCNPHGAGKWRREFSDSLRAKRVVVIADADQPGLCHARDIARSLMGVTEWVRLIEALPGTSTKDLSDFIAKFPDLPTARQFLLALIEDTPKLTAADIARWKSPQIQNGFTLMTLADLFSKPDTPADYLWDGRATTGTVSGIFAKPKVGKGTFARNLCLAVSRGEEFLGFKTKQGECIYLALEECEADIKRDFCAMGADGTEPILIHAAAAPADGIRALCELVRERKPRLVVIDPIIRLARIKDEKAYAETYTALGPLIDAARESGTHVMLLHHAGKSVKSDPTDSPLGSTAIGGAVASLIVMKRRESFRTIQTVQRIGEEMPETVLRFDPETKLLSIGGTREEAETQTVATEILDFLQAAAEPKTEPEIAEGVEAKTRFARRALRQLVGDGRVSREGGGKKGDPYFYRFLFPCSHHIAGTREQETENTSKPIENNQQMLVPEKPSNLILVPGIKTAVERGGL